MKKITAQLSLEIQLSESVLLSSLEEQKERLATSGVYFLHEGRPDLKVFSPYDQAVVYIGKAIRETIFSRCRKHRAAMRDERLSSGEPSMRPGKRFKAYRAARYNSIADLYVIPGVMDGRPFLISCAEEYLLYSFAEANGEYPAANTK